MAARNPGLASTSIEDRVVPVLSYLRDDLRVSQHELHIMLLRCPQLLEFHVELKMKPAYQFLVAGPPDGLGLTQQQALTVVQRFPHVLTLGVKSHLIPHLAVLKSLGVEESQLPALVLQRPAVLGPAVERITTHLIRYARVPRRQVGKLLGHHSHDYGMALIRVPRDMIKPVAFIPRHGLGDNGPASSSGSGGSS